jgi:hypothetical protein
MLKGFHAITAQKSNQFFFIGQERVDGGVGRGKESTAANGLPAGFYYDTYYKLRTPALLLSIQSTAVDCGLSRSLAPVDWIKLDRGGPPEVRTGLDRTSRSDPVCSPGRTVRNTGFPERILFRGRKTGFLGVLTRSLP